MIQFDYDIHVQNTMNRLNLFFIELVFARM